MAGSQRDTLQRLTHFRRGMDQLFRDVLDSDGGPAEFTIDIPVDIFQHPEELVIEAELPGLPREDIELYVKRDIVIIEGRKSEEPRASEESLQYHCLERSFGRFRRVIELTVPADTSRIEATHQQGVLTIRMPRIEERRGKIRRVEIT